jgi:hypothetical protein
MGFLPVSDRHKLFTDFTRVLLPAALGKPQVPLSVRAVMTALLPKSFERTIPSACWKGYAGRQLGTAEGHLRTSGCEGVMCLYLNA